MTVLINGTAEFKQLIALLAFDSNYFALSGRMPCEGCPHAMHAPRHRLFEATN